MQNMQNMQGTIPNSVVKNIRYGLATNSSSSHSIIHNPQEIKNGLDLDDDLSYQWDFFTLKSKEAKNNYMQAQLIENLNYQTVGAIGGILQNLGHNEAAEDLGELSVDHDSVIPFPKSATGYPGEKFINLNFFEEYKDYLVNNDFIILGGNDNADHEHELAPLDDKTESFMHSFSREDIAYKNGNYWVVQNKERKLRINYQGEEPVADKPELIDIKITDQCSMNCNFCYQGSTPDSPHGDLSRIKTIIKGSQKWGSQVEFAIGGGEPTEHPDFAEILNFMHNQDSIANFTTRATKWFEDEDLVETINNTVSGIAYSVSSIQDIEKFYDLHKKAFDDESKPVDSGPTFYLHLIPEIQGHDSFREMIGWIDEKNIDGRWTDSKIHVTLLGFKPLGRAEGRQPELIPEIVDVLMKTKVTPIGVDTKFATDYKKFLEAHGIDKKLYTTEEGQYSMYMDAVKSLAYKSSWQLDKPVDIIDHQQSRNSTRLFGIQDLFKWVNEPAEPAVPIEG